MLDLLCIGEAMAELRQAPDGTFKQGFAGDTFNTAVYAGRVLGAGKVGFYSRVGSDPLSNAFADFTADEGLNPAWLMRETDANIGIYSVATDAAGERSFHYWRNQSAARQLFDEPEELPDARLIYLSGITMALLSPEARKNVMQMIADLPDNALFAYDSQYRPKLWDSQGEAQDYTEAMWELTDIALPSIDDEMNLFNLPHEEDVLERFAGVDWTACAVKRGAQGPWSPTLDALPDFQPAAKVLDTTAAGDSFNAGYLAAFLTPGKSEADCLLAGHNLAAEVVGVPGAITPR